METKNGIIAVPARNRREWRDWLLQNGRSEKAVMLIIFNKKSKIPSITYPEAVEEALCFGWIDSKGMSRDGDSYYQTFTPRKPKSNWSKLNIKRAELMISQGLMTQEGMNAIELARSKGKWIPE